jgi:threonine/homoserine/homoserine lactone efflux protein
VDGIAAFVVASVVLILIPGPSLLFAISRALTVGRRRAIAAVAGNATGVALQAGAVAVGLGELVARSAAAFTVVKLVGAGYLVVLGVLAVRHRRRSAAALVAEVVPDQSAEEAARALPRALRCWADGLVVGGLNPKTVLFFIAFLPQFVPHGDGATVWMLGLGALFGLLAFLLDGVWVTVVATVRGRLVRSPRRLATLTGAGGVAMIGLGAAVAVTGRPI